MTLPPDLQRKLDAIERRRNELALAVLALVSFAIWFATGFIVGRMYERW